jgi:hypothetical protein
MAKLQGLLYIGLVGCLLLIFSEHPRPVQQEVHIPLIRIKDL